MILKNRKKPGVFSDDCGEPLALNLLKAMKELSEQLGENHFTNGAEPIEKRYGGGVFHDPKRPITEAQRLLNAMREMQTEAPGLA